MEKTKSIAPTLSVKFWLLFCASLFAGLILAWIDTRPNWDDTGIEVGIILCSSFCFGFAQPRFAWLWAVLVGIWIPVINVFVQHDFMSCVILFISFIGAYAGVLIQKVLKSSVA
ncbi:MAG TPA: hypothetical protein VMM37_11145 [Bacteroidota bacterium]|nr:hypothetical protein [Bacteroidota bacterium]